MRWPARRYRPVTFAALAFAALGTLLAAGCAGVPSTSATSKPTEGHSQAHPSPSVSKSADSPFTGLLAYLASRKGVITAAVYDAHARRTWVYHPQVLEYTASIVKVEIMGTALWEAQQGAGPLPQSEAALIPSMIEQSNNNAATSLLQMVGGVAKVKQFDQMAGLTATTPHPTLPSIPGTSLPAWGLTTTSALDEVILMRGFAYQNPVLSKPNRKYGTRLMEHVQTGQNWGVSAGVTGGATVALKNGWIQFPVALPNAAAGGWQIDSIGWIHGHGRNYVLAVLTANNPTMAYGQATISHVAQQVFAELGTTKH